MTEIAVSRNQKVFAVAESTAGTLVFPTGSGVSLGSVIPAGNASINQSPAFADSEEIRNSLDIIDRFQNSLPPGEWTLPMYLRPGGTVGAVPQGDILFQSLQGSKNAATTAALDGAITNSDTTITVDTVAGGVLSKRGVITVGTEKIYYGGLTDNGDGSYDLTSCVRGYAGTTAASALDDAAVTLSSVFYKQAVTAPAFSLWVQTDHFIQGLSGCTANKCTLSLKNEGAVMLNFSGQGMQMCWAGKDALTAGASLGASTITVSDAKRFSVNARIQNVTKLDHATNGYAITAVNYTTNVITVSPVLAAAWDSADVIQGYLPDTEEIGTPIESRRTSILINGVAGKMKATEISFDTPKQYINDEVGQAYPDDYVPNTRNITSNLNVYFRKDSAKYFYDGYQGNNLPVEVVYGNEDGKKMLVYMPKCNAEVPKINITNPTVELQMPLKSLGTAGEDSVEIVFI